MVFAHKPHDTPFRMGATTNTTAPNTVTVSYSYSSLKLPPMDEIYNVFEKEDFEARITR
jgi:hypothetical protein